VVNVHGQVKEARCGRPPTMSLHSQQRSRAGTKRRAVVLGWGGTPREVLGEQGFLWGDESTPGDGCIVL
jgi:hypothetical protein